MDKIYIQYYSAMKNNVILPFATILMNLEYFMLSEISETEKDKYHLYLGSKKIKQMNKQNKTKQNRDTENRLVFARGEGFGSGQNG